MVQPLLRCLSSGSLLTQDQMNDLYEGPPFELAVQYPVVLNSLFVTLMYCGGMPILIPFATLSFMLSFQFDKLFLLKLYSLPPKYDESLALLTATMLPYGLLLHLGISIWAYGQPD